MVGERGFEPPTPWSRTRCSTRLSHSPNLGCDSRALSCSGLVGIGKEARARLSVPEITDASPAQPPARGTGIWQSNAFAAYHRPMTPREQLHFGTVCILDGGMASELEFLGVNISGPLWSAHVLEEAPEKVIAVHRSYLRLAQTSCLPPATRSRARDTWSSASTRGAPMQPCCAQWNWRARPEPNLLRARS